MSIRQESRKEYFSHDRLETVQENHGGSDDALQFMRTVGSIDWTPEEERQVVRKIDCRLLPLMFCSTLVTLLESQVYGNAAVLGMVKDLGLYSVASVDPLTLNLNKYSWSVSITSFAVLVGQYPLLIIAQHLPLGKVSGACLLYNGCLCFLMLAAKGFTSTMVIRFFYGFQQVSTPLLILMTAMWWTAKEQPLRVAIWVSGSAFGSLIGQIIDYEIGQLKGHFANNPWKWLYLVISTITVILACLYLWLCPDTPMKCHFLSEREKIIAVQRLQKNHTGIQTRKFKITQVVDAVRDPSVYVICLLLFTYVFLNTSIATFGAYIVTSFGYSGIHSIRMLIPVPVVAFVCMLSSGVINSIIGGRRIILSIIFLIPSIAALFILWKTPRDAKGVLLAGLYLLPIYYGAFSQTYSLLATNIAGNTKKSTVNAMAFACSAIGGIVAPFAFKGTEAVEGYPTGMIFCISLLIACEVALVLLLLYYIHFNKRQESRMQEALNTSSISVEDVAFLDLVEKENVFFRYQY